MTIAAWRYAFPADRLLQAFKYGGRLALAEPLAIALADAVSPRGAPLPDRLFALPLAIERQRASRVQPGAGDRAPSSPRAPACR